MLHREKFTDRMSESIGQRLFFGGKSQGNPGYAKNSSTYAVLALLPAEVSTYCPEH
jgi:hypothetical protein